MRMIFQKRKGTPEASKMAQGKRMFASKSAIRDLILDPPGGERVAVP